MVRRLSMCLCLVAIVSMMAMPAFAAVQNVKVSGDITAAGVYRNDFDLQKRGGPGSGNTTSTDKEEDFLSITRLRVDADLTDNVSTTVRLLNERNWNGDSTVGVENNRNIGFNAANAIDVERQIDIDLANVTLKEFLYSPLTLTVGRQELRFGNGMIVGDPDTNGVALDSALAEGDLSARKAFDAIRAKLDYNPLVIDLIYAKVAERNTILDDDTTLTGINATYELNKETTLEGFFFSKIRGKNQAAVTNVDAGNATSFSVANGVKQKTDIVNTIGGRVVNKSVKNLTIDAQGAYQFGTYNPNFDPNARYTSATQLAGTAPRSAWGAEAILSYDLKDVASIAKWEPVVSAAYVFLSGANKNRTGSKTYKGWDAMFEDQTSGHILNAIMGYSNAHILGASLKAKPVADITAKLDYVALWFAKRYPANELVGSTVNLSGVSTAQTFRLGDGRFVGQEVDLTLTYDYTEDVQFSLLGGIFLPTDVINEGPASQGVLRERAAAKELIASMKVTF